MASVNHAQSELTGSHVRITVHLLIMVNSATLKCNCSLFQECHHIFGCVCPVGYTGNKCDQACPEGTFGENCAEKTVVVQYAQRVTILQAPVPVLNSRVNLKYQQERHLIQVISLVYTLVDDHSSHLITVYIGMAAALMVLVCIVASIVKIKQEVYRYLRSGKKNCPTMNLKRRKNIPKKSERNTRNVSVEAASNILETHAQPFLCELGDGYCEISEVSVSNHTCTRQNDVDQINSTS
ncbi:unnamed protein product [Mytilus edulis]|uniref:EGF-like domain-containing protein n=1 Tax=Mytilus edulis TaxID=6550 RepID=A0A8S3PP16_MYTED|nr:unnamed protein product [Mytilus edulis]